MIKPAKIFRKPILDMHPYAAPIEGRTKGNYLLLDFNERTISPHPLVYKAINEYISKGKLQMYPEYGDLNQIVAEYIGVNSKEVILTSGSDQGIDIVTRALVGNQDKVVIPIPTFAMLMQCANIQGASIVSPSYKGMDFSFPFDEVMESITPGVKLVIICKPNNPTGTPVSKEQSEEIIKKANEVGAGVLADEAYHEFSPEFTVVDLINKYSNLFVTRTFSKTMGIPSLRAGVIISQEQNIEQFNKIRGPYDLNTFAAAAVKTLRYEDVREDIKRYTSEVMKVSKPRIEKFYIENGVKFAPSAANFHLIKVPNLYDFMKTKSILVRPRSDIKDWVRVSIGTNKDTERYLEAFREYLD